MGLFKVDNLTCNHGYMYCNQVFDLETQYSPPYKLKQLLVYFLQLGTLGFGGPVALVGFMHHDLVEARAWISEAEYKEGLALAQLAPGPLAAQLAMYLGYVHYGVLGSSLAGLAFVLPSFVMVVLLGWAYTNFGGLVWIQAVFYGVSACVIGIIAHSAYKLSLKTLARDRLLWFIFLVAGAWTVITESEALVIFIGWYHHLVYEIPAALVAEYLECLRCAFAGGNYAANPSLNATLEYLLVFLSSRCVCVWEWSGNRAIFICWRGERASLVD